MLCSSHHLNVNDEVFFSDCIRGVSDEFDVTLPVERFCASRAYHATSNEGASNNLASEWTLNGVSGWHV